MSVSGDLAALGIAREALDVEPAGREAFISERCAGDAALRASVDKVLARMSEATAGAEAPPVVDRLPGTQLGPFRVCEKIGHGGMGVVYRGERDVGGFRQEVAIKLIRRGFDFDDIRARFLRERRILARLDHPGLARLIDGGTTEDGRPWFALEFVRGESITRWCDRERLDLRARMRLLLEVCAAVQYAHAQLVVHRDLKPGNVLVNARGEVRLLDFGIAGLLEHDDTDATLTRPDARRAFTPEYAAPEQFRGESAGVATDVYALGAMAYALVAGVPPRAGRPQAGAATPEAPPQPLSQAIARPLAGAGDAAETESLTQRLAARSMGLRDYRKLVRGDLSRIIDKALAPEPERRYGSAQAFADDLGRWLDGKPVQVSGNALGYRVRKFVLRNRLPVALAALAGLALVAGLVATLWQAQQTRHQRDEALAEVRRAESVRQYLMLMFRDAAAPGAAEVNVREIFRLGAERLFERFADRPAAGQETALMLSDFYLQLGDVQGGVALLERLLTWPGIEANPAVLAHARYNLAQAEAARGNDERAQALLDQAQAYWRRDSGAVQQALLNESRQVQARLQRQRGDTDGAVATLRAAIAERRRMLDSDDVEVANQQSSLAIALLQGGDREAASAATQEAMRILATLGLETSDSAMAALGVRAQLALAAGQMDAAIADYRRVVVVTRNLYGDSSKLATALNNLGLVLLRTGQSQAAIPELREALRIARRSDGERARQTVALHAALAEALAVSGRPADAAPLAETAVAIATQDFARDAALLGSTYRVRARVRLGEGQLDEARDDLAAARERFRSMGKAGEPFLQRLQPLEQELGE